MNIILTIIEIKMDGPKKKGMEEVLEKKDGNESEWTDEQIKEYCKKHPGQTSEQVKAEIERAKNL